MFFEKNTENYVKLKKNYIGGEGVKVKSKLIVFFFVFFMFVLYQTAIFAMPPAEEKILIALEKRGQIPPGLTSSQKEIFLKAYLQKKLGKKGEDKVNSEKAKKLELLEKSRNGNSATNDDKVKERSIAPSKPLPYPQKYQVDKVLVLLVEFSDEAGGPLHNQLPPLDPGDNLNYWVADFNAQHYKDMLFNRSPLSKSLANFYLEQSDGKYTLTGDVYGWIKLPYPESYYGADDNAGGTDNLNGPVWRIVKDAVLAAKEQGINIPYKDFDLDKDGYVDHVFIIHAGAGQEAGGGLQGDDAIWSHSWFVDWQHGGVTTADGTKIGPYTIEPEDGTVGVFAHEFGHDLGLPDMYDVTYYGESSTGFYTLMSSGSWLGRPLGTEPAHLDAWSKYLLGWVDPEVIKYGSEKQIKLRQSEIYGTYNKAAKLLLPPKDKVLELVVPHSGSKQWYSNQGDNLNNTLTFTADLTGKSSATLRFWTWYEIESGYDYGFVEVSTDNGQTWTSIPGNITEPLEGGGYGITGYSGAEEHGWVEANFDLSNFAGKVVQIRFRYFTDGGWIEKGWLIDDIAIPEIGYFNDLESSAGEFVADGWMLAGESVTQKVGQYYLLEWRNTVGFDAGLLKAYNYNPLGVDNLYYNPGLLIWYRDMAYSDNNVGLHPGRGMMLIVDSHPEVLRQANGVPFRTRIQIADATFGQKETYAQAITGRDGITVNLEPLPGQPVFDDSLKYWRENKPDSSVITPNLGVKVEVLAQSFDNSSALINIVNGK